MTDKITAQQIDSLTHEVSHAIETRTDITVGEDDLYALNDTLTRFFMNTLQVGIIEEEEPFEVGKFLTLPANCHYGVVAFPKDSTFGDELHGPFLTETEARIYIGNMQKEYEDYERFAVCKIELPVVSPDVQPAVGPDERGNMLYRQDARP